MSNQTTQAQVLMAGSAMLASYGAYQLLNFLYGAWASPMRTLRGPPSPSFVSGHVYELRNDVCLIFTKIIIPFAQLVSLHAHQNDSQLQQKWIAQYGQTFKVNGIFGVSDSSSSVPICIGS